MDRPALCPGCLSKYEEIHGLIFAAGSTASTQCDHDWHRGVTWNPDRWVLTPFDEEFLSEQKVASR